MAHTNPIQSNTEDSEDTQMHDMDSLPPLDRVAQQILSELRDFRKEWSERNTREERVEFGPRAPTVTSSIPGQYPCNASVSQSPWWTKMSCLLSSPVEISGPANALELKTVQETSAVHIELGQYHEERAKLESFYECEMKKLRDEAEEKKQLWEDLRVNNVNLSQQLTEQVAKVTKLQRMMARAGRNDNTNIDSDINAQFIVLKNSILQMVKNHFSYIPKKTRSPPSPELGELYLRQMVAMALYDKFFSQEAMPFGFDDQLFDKSPLRSFEKTLRKNHCDGMYLLQVNKSGFSYGN